MLLPAPLPPLLTSPLLPLPLPHAVYRINKHYTKNEQRMPLILVKLYVYQMLRALAHIHSLGVCHRCVCVCVGGGGRAGGGMMRASVLPC